MPQIVVHHEGLFNLFDTRSDAAVFSRGVTEWELCRYIREERGMEGVRALADAIELARKTGTSCREPTDLASLIQCNRAGPREKELTPEQFIARFLTPPG